MSADKSPVQPAQSVKFELIKEDHRIFLFVESPDDSPENLDVIDLVYQAIQGATKQKAQILDSRKLAATFVLPQRNTDGGSQ